MTKFYVLVSSFVLSLSVHAQERKELTAKDYEQAQRFLLAKLNNSLTMVLSARYGYLVIVSGIGI